MHYENSEKGKTYIIKIIIKQNKNQLNYYYFFESIKFVLYFSNLLEFMECGMLW